jgi:DNA-binding PadR family transcriptional regulator
MRPLPILDLYLLSLLDRGLRSLYDLQKVGGLSLGASTPALKRLANGGYVKQEKSEKTGSRVRFQFHLTPAGRAQARSAWRQWLNPKYALSDLDALLRLVDLAVHYGHPKSRVSELLVRATEQRHMDARIALATSARLKEQSLISYPALRAWCDHERLEAEAKVLVEMNERLGVKQKSTERKRSSPVRTTSTPRRLSRSKPR